MLKRVGHNSGMVLVTVLMFIIAMSILTIGILGQNVSQATSAQEKIDQIRAQELAQGAYAKFYADRIAGVVTTSFTAENIDGKLFAPVISPQGAGRYDVSVTY